MDHDLDLEKIVTKLSVMTGSPRYTRGEDACACVGQTEECKRPKIDFTRYFIHVWIGAPLGTFRNCFVTFLSAGFKILAPSP